MIKDYYHRAWNTMLDVLAIPTDADMLGVPTEPVDFAERLNGFVSMIHAANQEAGWWTDPMTGEDLRKNPYVVATKMMLIVSEISEAVEAYRKDLMDSHLPNRPGVEAEMADAFIRIADLCGVLGLDLGGAVMEKNAYNQKRADHKVENRQKAGGKKF